MKSAFPIKPVAVAILYAGLLSLTPGCGRSKNAGSTDPDKDQAAKVVLTAEAESEIVQFCSGCHAPPRPSSFPKEAWAEEVEQGFELFHDSDRMDLRPPRPVSLVIDYYRDLAPEQFEFPSYDTTQLPLPISFVKEDLKLFPGAEPVVVSHVRVAPQTKAHQPGLLVCDMEHGRLIWTDPQQPEKPGLLLETFHNPASVTVVDLDEDGEQDYLIGDLGSFLPDDHRKGKVYWLHQDKDSGEWIKEILLSRVGRVVDVEAGDFDGDSQIDLVVSEFGWRRTGSVILLRNQTTEAGDVKFKKEEIDSRSGAIQIEKCDLNDDGHLDFVTVFSQEHEEVVAFLNDGEGAFEAKTVWNAGFPSYGSSGIELVDMDGDEDIDVLYTNGDSFDDFLTKPYHGVQWLENRGDDTFAHHELTKMPGVHRALAGDMDGDGDLDVVAVAMLPDETRESDHAKNLDSIVLLEQVDQGRFIRHSVEKRQLDHASFEIGDFDGDDDLDLAVGVFLQKESDSRVKIWWNQSNDAN